LRLSALVMKSSIFWSIKTCSLLKTKIMSAEHFSFIHRDEEWIKQKTVMKQVASSDFQRTTWHYILEDRPTQNIKLLCLNVRKQDVWRRRNKTPHILNLDIRWRWVVGLMFRRLQTQEESIWYLSGRKPVAPKKWFGQGDATRCTYWTISSRY
jgi:hypothetical protein